MVFCFLPLGKQYQEQRMKKRERKQPGTIPDLPYLNWEKTGQPPSGPFAVSIHFVYAIDCHLTLILNVKAFICLGVCDNCYQHRPILCMIPIHLYVSVNIKHIACIMILKMQNNVMFSTI